MDRDSSMEGKPEGRYEVRMRQMGVAIEKILRKSYPPGYEYKREWVAAWILLGIGVVWNFRFFEALYSAVGELYVYIRVDGQLVKTLREGVEASSFMQVADGYWRYFIPLLLFLVIMAGYHYLYYYRESKSIYLMKRLPKRRVLLSSCIQGPLLSAGIAAAAAVACYLLYFGIYLLAMPAESMPRFM